MPILLLMVVKPHVFNVILQISIISKENCLNLRIMLSLLLVPLQVDAAVIRFKLKQVVDYPSVASPKSFFSMVILHPHSFHDCLVYQIPIYRIFDVEFFVVAGNYICTSI